MRDTPSLACSRLATSRGAAGPSEHLRVEDLVDGDPAQSHAQWRDPRIVGDLGSDLSRTKVRDFMHAQRSQPPREVQMIYDTESRLTVFSVVLTLVTSIPKSWELV